MDDEMIPLPLYLGLLSSLAQWEKQRGIYPGSILLLSVFLRENEPSTIPLHPSPSQHIADFIPKGDTVGKLS